jgi:hypothetical protein
LKVRAPWRAGRLAVAALLLAGAAAGSQASSASPRLCDRTTALSATQQDRLLQFAAVAKRELEASGQAVALVARSGLDLSRFQIRYSHAGVSLRASENAPWSVRQLYFACDEGRPRLFDQGLPGFVFGTDDPSLGYLSIVLLPRAQADVLERAALDTPRALQLLAARYSANAYAFGLRYQNCNQWVMELLASAWGELEGADASLRARAQAWLAEQGYAPRPVELGSHALMFAAGFIPWLHHDDHPSDDLFALRFRISLPASIEAFVRERLPGAQRIELCHDERQIVIRRGWTPIGDGCRAEAGDQVLALD